MNKYFVCDQGIIWTVFGTGKSNYPGQNQIILNSKIKTVYIVNSSTKEVIGDYTLWDTLTDLARAIEGDLTAIKALGKLVQSGLQH